MVTAPATYGDLMLRAAIGIRHGVVWMQNLPLEREEYAQTAINDFLEVLRALKEHTFVLLEMRRVNGIRVSGAPDPREEAALRLGELLHDVVGANPPWAWVGAKFSPSPWATAARCVRAASELVATHSDADGEPRTPDLDAVLRHPAARQAGLAQVGDLVATIVSGEDYLALRAAQSGVPWPQVRHQLPDLGEVRAYARDVAGIGSLPTWAHLDDLTVASAPIRTGEPAAQFSDRMLRLRRIAWHDVRSAHPSVDTLKTYATLGIAVHAHALAFHGVQPAALRADEPIPRQLESVASRGRAWQEVSRALVDWRSAQPGDPVVEQDFARVSGLLRTFAPLSGDQPDLSPGDRRHLGQAISAACAMTADIGRWNQTTAERMGRGHQVYVPARSLTGSQVTWKPELADAKLSGRCVPADGHRIETVDALYTRTIAHKDPALLGAGGLTLRAEPLRTVAKPAPGHDPIERSR
ncbi:hypothetical protein [Pengzhenrongella sp.]|jgi:hypothetical protein|uniref:hypothetical protein n=1 Tax=Pengzhenrongella sp. TaxID=2888820 RepID=UPI002F95A512